MSKRLIVEFEREDEWGYVDGYLRGKDDKPYAVVFLPDKECAVLAPLHALKYKKDQGTDDI